MNTTYCTSLFLYNGATVSSVRDTFPPTGIMRYLDSTDSVNRLCAVSREVVFLKIPCHESTRIEASGTQTAREDDEKVPLFRPRRQRRLEMAKVFWSICFLI
jgi:hypothetical protein